MKGRYVTGTLLLLLVAAVVFFLGYGVKSFFWPRKTEITAFQNLPPAEPKKSGEEVKATTPEATGSSGGEVKVSTDELASRDLQGRLKSLEDKLAALEKKPCASTCERGTSATKPHRNRGRRAAGNRSLPQKQVSEWHECPSGARVPTGTACPPQATAMAPVPPVVVSAPPTPTAEPEKATGVLPAGDTSQQVIVVFRKGTKEGPAVPNQKVTVVLKDPSGEVRRFGLKTLDTGNTETFTVDVKPGAWLEVFGPRDVLYYWPDQGATMLRASYADFFYTDASGKPQQKVGLARLVFVTR